MSRPIHLLDLVSREKLERILQVFTEVAEVASIITYADGHPITEPHHFTPFCLHYCRATPKGRIKCFESDRYGGSESARLRAPFSYQCLNSGLGDCAAPVIINGYHLATVLCGQVLEKPIDTEVAIQRAEEIGVEDIEGYLRELAKVPLMSRERLRNIANLMSEITVTISELAIQKHTAQQNSQRYLCRLINSVSDCIISTDADNTVSMVNQAGAAMFGYRMNQIIGQPIHMLLADERSRTTYLNKAGSNSGGNWRADLTAIRADSSLFPVQVSFSALHDDHETRAGCVGVIRDISEEKKLERMKEDLIGMITHDLRNPVLSLERALQIVVGGTLGSLNRDQKNVLELALVTSHQLFGMVSDILDIYRKENGKFMLRCAEVGIQRAVEQSLKQMELLTREKRITLKVEAPSAPLEVTVDEGRIRRTCTNLLDNAIKYSPEGGNIAIRIQGQRNGDDRPERPPAVLPRDVPFSGAGQQGWVIVSVEDEGIGIPEAYHECIFDKYFTLKTSEVASREGVGLGLAFCKLAVEAHGGRIWVESPVTDGARGVKRGCRFYFTLPFSGSELAD
ncbi:MAG: PocR ligand-binding domain-containing protein [Syntrophobacteraceae bacterium]|jgi:PAS domain S-box-containing protein